MDIRGKYGTPLILYVGRLVYYKGCESAIRAMALVPDAKLVMVGRGPLESKLKELISELKLESRVHLIGWQSENELRSLFQLVISSILPSIFTTECFGLVQVEAMLLRQASDQHEFAYRCAVGKSSRRNGIDR